MQANLLRFQPDQKYILWDLETCHLNLTWEENKPWQIGWVRGIGSDIVETKNYFIKWEPLNISEGAAKVTRFDRKKYESNWVEPQIVLDEFEKYLYNEEYKIVGHNLLNFDVYIHNIWRKHLNRPVDYSYLPRLIDTNCLAKAIKLDIKLKEDNNLLNFQYGMLHHIEKGLKTNLTAISKEYKIEFDYDNLHDAAKDVELNWIVWNKMKLEIDI